MIKHVTHLEPLREAFYGVFRSNSPFEPAGRDELPVRVVLFPTGGYHLDADQFQALEVTLLECEEREFYISEVEGQAGLFDPGSPWKRDNWECVNPSFEEYAKLPIGVESALYSKKGSWGILISHELHGLLVCKQNFWTVFQKHYPNWEEDFRKFTEYWQELKNENGLQLEWMAPLLSHLHPSVDS